MTEINLTSRQTLMPLTKLLVDRSQILGLSFDPQTLLVAVQHGLKQTPDLLSGLNACGLPFANMYWLGKSYSSSQSIVTKMANLGINVTPSSLPEPGTFQDSFKDDVARLWEHVAKRAAYQDIKNILILDDGGYALTTVPQTLLRSKKIIGVEQTAGGTFQLGYKKLPFAVVEVATCGIKREIESHLIADAVAQKCSSSVHLATAKSIGVIGLGAIGRALLTHLAVLQPEKELLSYDRSLKAGSPGVGEKRTSSLRYLLANSDVVFGCTGRDIFRSRNISFATERPITFASCSSGDIEFNALIKKLGRTGTLRLEGSDFAGRIKSSPITILRHGFPVNFNGQEESVPTDAIQITTGLLFAALLQSRVLLELPKPPRGPIMLDPGMQRFVYERWVHASQSGIELCLNSGITPIELQRLRFSEAIRDLSKGKLVTMAPLDIFSADKNCRLDSVNEHREEFKRRGISNDAFVALARSSMSASLRSLATHY